MKTRILSIFLSFFTFSLSAQSFQSLHQCQKGCRTLTAAEWEERQNLPPLNISRTKATGSAICVNPTLNIGLNHYIGAMHEHSSYSDGHPSAIPSTYYNRAKNNGLDFIGGTEHSDSYSIPLALHGDCVNPITLLTDCITTDYYSPQDSFNKWGATKTQSDTITKNGQFVAIRGFEWTSDRFGHINVYFSQNLTNAKDDGGYVLMPTFYQWLSTPPQLTTLNGVTEGYGGADGLAVFNHPGDKSLSDDEPGFNWNDFTFEPSVDTILVGMEVFNDGRDYAYEGGRTFYQQALDKGWHIGAIASEDHHETNWANATNEKTVFVAPSLTRADLKNAMKNRRMYATRDQSLRMSFKGDNELMGSKIRNKIVGQTVTLSGEVASTTMAKIELISNLNTKLATFTDCQFSYIVPVTATEKWYYIRVADANDRTLAYSSPIWVMGSNVVLPVELLSFDIKNQNDNALLTWQVGTEQQVSHYEIERSTDGIRFEKIGSLKAKNQPNYTFLDKNTSFGKSYYRLKTIDIDQKESLSKVVFFEKVPKKLEITYINAQQVQIFSPIEQKANITLFDIQGRVIQQENTFFQVGNNHFWVDALTQGIYFLQIQNNATHHTFKIIL